MSHPETKLHRIKLLLSDNASNIFDALFVFVLVFSLVSRLSTLDYPRNNEVYRDYLISHHVVAYGEHPATGPHNSVFASIRNSPFYFYFAAGILYIHDSILTLQVANVILQAFALIFFYLFGRRLFSPAIAWTAVVLYALSWVNGQQAFEFWQPYVMQPFALASLWLFARGWQEKRYQDLWTAIALVTVGGVFHYSAFALLLMYAIALLYILKRWKASWQDYVTPLLIVAVTIVAAYTSVFWFASRHPELLAHSITGKGSFVGSFSVFAANLLHNGLQLIKVFFVPFTRYQWLRFITGAVALVSVVYYLILASRPKRTLGWLMFGALCVPVVIAALFSSPPFDYYYEPVFSLFLLLLTAGIFTVLDSGRVLPIVRWLVIIGLVVVFSADGYFAKAQTFRSEHEQQRQAIVASVDKEITELQQSDGFAQKDFFQFWVYQKGNPYRGQDAFFWDLLEKRWGQQQVHVVDYANGYLSDNVPYYQFFVCQDFGDLELDQCRQFYFDKSPGYSVVKELYHKYPYVIYLTKYTADGIIN